MKVAITRRTFIKIEMKLMTNSGTNASPPLCNLWSYRFMTGTRKKFNPKTIYHGEQDRKEIR